MASQDVWRDERSRIVVVGALEELVSSKHIIEAIRKVEFVSLLCLTLSLNVATGLHLSLGLILSLTERSGIPCRVAPAVILLEHLCARLDLERLHVFQCVSAMDTRQYHSPHRRLILKSPLNSPLDSPLDSP